MVQLKFLTAILLAISVTELAAKLPGNEAAVAEDILALNAENLALQKQLDETKTDLDDVIALNAKHEASIEAFGKAPAIAEKGEEPTFKVGEDTYGFAIPKLNHKGVQITAVEVCADEKLQAELITMGSGMIYKK